MSWNEPCNKSVPVIKLAAMKWILDKNRQRRKSRYEYWEEKFRPEDLQRLRGFRLMDDDFMSKCFEENIECNGVGTRLC